MGLLLLNIFNYGDFETEQALYIENGGDQTFDPGDYLLFYGKKNHTWLDSLLYDDPSDISNKYYPHYNDTITYFLTINSTGNHKRILTESSANYMSHPTTPYVLETSYEEYHNAYVEGFQSFGLSFSQYVNGEGWSTGRYNALDNINFLNTNLNTTHAYTGTGAPNVSGIAVSSGASDAKKVLSANHHLQLKNESANTILTDLIYSGYQKNDLTFSFPVAELGGNTTTIRHEFINDLQVTADQQVVHYV